MNICTSCPQKWKQKQSRQPRGHGVMLVVGRCGVAHVFKAGTAIAKVQLHSTHKDNSLSFLCNSLYLF